MSTGLALNFGALFDDHGAYRDACQLRIIKDASDLLNWDMKPFDNWLYGVDHWRSFPKTRQRLIVLREQLALDYQATQINDGVLEECLYRYFYLTSKLAMRMRNFPAPLRQAMAEAKAQKRPTSHTKIDPVSGSRIHRLYEEMVVSGQKYGAKTKLARQYGVSLVTIRKVLLSKRPV